MSLNLVNRPLETATIQPTSEITHGRDTTSGLAVQHEPPVPVSTPAEQESSVQSLIQGTHQDRVLYSSINLPQPSESIRLGMLQRAHSRAQFRAELAARSARINERFEKLGKVRDELKRDMQGMRETIADIERANANKNTTGDDKYTTNDATQGGEALQPSPEETRLARLLMLLTTLRRDAAQP